MKSGKVFLTLGFHIHQPVGNFESVFKFATEESYLPLLQTFHNHESIKFALHISGPVWEYLEHNFHSIFSLISDMVDRGQCELLGGGFYEPILAVIPENDAQGQLMMMSDYLNENFGVLPRGIWLTERIWEPHLPALLASQAIKYLAVDDYHLKAVGYTDDELAGYFITEHDGKPLGIFPISEYLRYTIPFAPVEKTIAYLEQLRESGENKLAIFADDGEKFGLWPGTKAWVWEKHWLEDFLTALETNSSWIETLTFSEAQERLPSQGMVYMPTGSYFEMSEWTLPAELSYEFGKLVTSLKKSGDFEHMRPFVKGGFWRNFFTKYAESNWMHKRMIWVSQTLAEKRKKIPADHREAQIALYKAQCNCAYWHGVFGGLYLPHLREGIWTNILQAERLALDNLRLAKLIIEDVDFDGKPELRLSNGNLIAWVSPARGGTIEEISLFDACVNIVNTLSRRVEGYHKKLIESAVNTTNETDNHASIHDRVVATEDGLEQLLQYDKHVRRVAHDHFLLRECTLDDFASGDYTELGDFVTGDYEVIEEYSDKNGAAVQLLRKGNIFHGGELFPIFVYKRIEVLAKEHLITVLYEIENESNWLDFRFVSESNFSLLSRDDPARYIRTVKDARKNIPPKNRMTIVNPGGYEVADEARHFSLECACKPNELWIFPVETVSNSEHGFERVFQEACVCTVHDFRLKRGEKIAFSLSWRISQ